MGFFILRFDRLPMRARVHVASAALISVDAFVQFRMLVLYAGPMSLSLDAWSRGCGFLDLDPAAVSFGLIVYRKSACCALSPSPELSSL